MEDIILNIIIALSSAIVSGLVVGWTFVKGYAAKTENKIDDKIVELLETFFAKVQKDDVPE